MNSQKGNTSYNGDMSDDDLQSKQIDVIASNSIDELESSTNLSEPSPGLMNIVDIEIGRRIKFRRSEMKLSQKALGSKIGVTFQQIQKYEKGKNRIIASRLYLIAQILKVPVNYFFDEEPTYSTTNSYPQQPPQFFKQSQPNYQFNEEAMHFQYENNVVAHQTNNDIEHEMSMIYARIQDKAIKLHLLQLIKTIELKINKP